MRCDKRLPVPGVICSGKDAKSPKQRFDLFITPNVIDLIVYFTNLWIRESLEKCSEQIKDSDRYPHLKEIDSTELYAFIGLNYYCGLYNMNNHSTKILFSDEKGLPFFGATMSRLGYEFIFLSFVL